jgi:lysyl-tRNA synthetase class 1
VKTSASLSGVLHIGRLSDSIRGESVYKSLSESVNAKLVWVAEDMDPLRKVPEGVPKAFVKHIGMPVTDIPDPDGCHDNYADHHKAEYFKVFHDFVGSKLKTYSMREEYRKGEFKPYIKKLMEKSDLVREIQNKYRRSPLPSKWTPWTPICENCGKIITTVVTGEDNGIISYRCDDYSFEKHKAEGCGHRGENDPMKGEGKLMWKGEWAAQWNRWGIVAEGAGKEYQVPGSAWWVNAEICERVLDFPMPVPIFYEYLLIDGTKMSASLGNVVYPREWKAVAKPELLKFIYNKRLMKTRTFSWTDLPTLYEDYKRHERIFYGKEKGKTDKETLHAKRLYELSQNEKHAFPLQLPFRLCTMIVQVFGLDTDKAGEILKGTGHIKGKYNKEEVRVFLERIKRWIDNYAPDEYKISLKDGSAKGLGKGEREYLSEFASGLRGKSDVKELCRDIMGERGIGAKEFFANVYKVLFGKDHGPRLAEFVEVYGRSKVADAIDGVLK